MMRIAGRFLLAFSLLLVASGNVPQVARGQPAHNRAIKKTEVPVCVDDLVAVVEVEVESANTEADEQAEGETGRDEVAPALYTFKIQGSRLALERLVLGPDPDRKRTALDRRLVRRVSLIDGLCGLSDNQKAKLLLAGRGDLHRLLGHLDELLRAFASEYTAVNDSQAGLNRVRKLLQSLVPMRAKVKESLFENGSLFVKTASSVLTADQMTIFARQFLVEGSDGRRAKEMCPSQYQAGDAPGESSGRMYLHSSNAPKAIHDRALLERKKVVLVAEPASPVRDGQQFSGMRLWLVNGTDRKTRFRAMDDEILIVQQALDDDGAWKPIEFIQWSGCGNSMHSLSLNPGQGWEIAAPQYAGPMATKLRFVLRGWHEGELIYSNEFDGSIDPGQFDP